MFWSLPYRLLGQYRGLRKPWKSLVANPPAHLNHARCSALHHNRVRRGLFRDRDLESSQTAEIGEVMVSINIAQFIDSHRWRRDGRNLFNTAHLLKERKHLFPRPAFCFPIIKVDLLRPNISKKIDWTASARASSCCYNSPSTIEVLGRLSSIKCSRLRSG